MKKETKEYIFTKSKELIEFMRSLLDDQSVLTETEEAWLEDAEAWLSYTKAHYKPEEV